MCGRYELDVSAQALLDRYDLTELDIKYLPNEEIFPTNDCPVIVQGSELVIQRWGFIEKFTTKPLINARQETILKKATFRDSFMMNRCLIPATAFFEWSKNDDKKKKFRVSVKEQDIFSMAGISKLYQQPDGTILRTFSILTTEAGLAFKKIHHRMPVILKPEDEAHYLDPNISPAQIKQLVEGDFSRPLIINNV